MRICGHTIMVLLSVLWGWGCASVKQTEVSTVPKEVPEKSRTITQQQERFLKRKVAIARFSNETKYGQGFFYDEHSDRLGKQAMDILSAKLTATDKFIMLERADLERLAKEQELGGLGDLNIPADYLILGSVAEFGRKTTSDVGLFSRTKTQTATAKVNVRLVDVRTGLIVYSEEGEAEATAEAGTVLGVGERAEYDATLNDKVISAAISKLVNNIVENLLDKPWRSYLLAYEDGSYIISGGELQGIKVGDVFTVFKRGSQVKNPQTGIMIELPPKKIGQLQVASLVPGDVTSEVSICTAIAGDIPTSEFSDLFAGEEQLRGDKP